MKLDRNEELLTQITQAIFRKADKENLEKNRVVDSISELQHIFHKDSKKKERICFVCAFCQELELHHLAGRNNSELTCTLCSFCHASLSNRQQIWDSRWTYTNNSDDLRSSFAVAGIFELLTEKHFRTGIKDYRIMADALPSLIKSYLEKANDMSKKEIKTKTSASLGSAAKQEDSFFEEVYKNCLYETEDEMLTYDEEHGSYELHMGRSGDNWGSVTVTFSRKELMAIKDALVKHFGK